ncbi:TetR/AcrR family transcriptional regulator [Nocardia sp. NPDC024068]|uniref:TetR/AcrR family transcriptional regulator n=1 Tax=Nocardia sp. NPDC024068 TaxID=3157197 RepID=UPI0033ED5CB5
MAASRTTTRTRNPRGEGGRLRDEIVTAAVGLLDETGDANAVTLRSVARSAGIAAPSIYRHFPDQPAVMLAVVRSAFADLEVQLRIGLDAAGESPRGRLVALCEGYLDYARTHSGRYRTMFGGVWMPDLHDSSVTREDVATLGDTIMALLVDALERCIAAGESTSTDAHSDTVALWLGLHGLAHQRASTVAFPWPPDIAERLIGTLAHLTE